MHNRKQYLLLRATLCTVISRSNESLNEGFKFPFEFALFSILFLMIGKNDVERTRNKCHRGGTNGRMEFISNQIRPLTSIYHFPCCNRGNMSFNSRSLIDRELNTLVWLLAPCAPHRRCFSLTKGLISCGGGLQYYATKISNDTGPNVTYHARVPRVPVPDVPGVLDHVRALYRASTPSPVAVSSRRPCGTPHGPAKPRCCCCCCRSYTRCFPTEIQTG